MFSRNTEEAGAAGAERMKGNIVDKFREVIKSLGGLSLL